MWALDTGELYAVTLAGYLVCGEITNTGMLKYPENVKVITAVEYDNYLGTVKVTFNTNEGTAIDPVVIGYDTKLTAPATPEREHYSFLGWYTDEALTTEFSFDTPVTSDITLYAKWKLNEFTVTFDANYGTTSVNTMEVIYGEAYGDMPVPTRTGYTFNGWYTAKKGGTKITAETVVTAAANHTLYAQWTVNAYKATWNTGTGYTITVKRTSSPCAEAPIGILSSGDAIYYGDVLSITYAAKTGYTLGGKGKTSITVTGNVTSSDIYTSATVNSYTVSWSTGTGYTITVKRTSSPLKGASTGTLANNATVYYGDVLSVTYTANTGYTLGSTGKTSITVTGNVTKDDIYASASANSYTYKVVYKSSNGTDLGGTEVTNKFATTNTISAPAKTGYVTPDSQSVKWDATSKTITFTYKPASVSFTTKTGKATTTPTVTFSAEVQFRNRTATSIEMRIVWTDTMAAYGYNAQAHKFDATFNGVSAGRTQIASYYTWENSASYARSETGTSSWVTVSVSATTTSVSVSVQHLQTNIPGTVLSKDYSGTWTISIPTY